MGTAVAANVLTGKTFTNASSVGVTGTMADNGAVSKTFTPSTSVQSYTVPAGYHNGSGTVTCNAIRTETKTFKPTTNSTSHNLTPTSGKYIVKTGTVSGTIPSGTNAVDITVSFSGFSSTPTIVVSVTNNITATSVNSVSKTSASIKLRGSGNVSYSATWVAYGQYADFIMY